MEKPKEKAGKRLTDENKIYKKIDQLLTVLEKREEMVQDTMLTLRQFNAIIEQITKPINNDKAEQEEKDKEDQAKKDLSRWKGLAIISTIVATSLMIAIAMVTTIALLAA